MCLFTYMTQPLIYRVRVIPWRGPPGFQGHVYSKHFPYVLGLVLFSNLEQASFYRWVSMTCQGHTGVSGGARMQSSTWLYPLYAKVPSGGRLGESNCWPITWEEMSSIVLTKCSRVSRRPYPPHHRCNRGSPKIQNSMSTVKAAGAQYLGNSPPTQLPSSSSAERNYLMPRILLICISVS